MPQMAEERRRGSISGTPGTTSGTATAAAIHRGLLVAEQGRGREEVSRASRPPFAAPDVAVCTAASAPDHGPRRGWSAADAHAGSTAGTHRPHVPNGGWRR